MTTTRSGKNKGVKLQNLVQSRILEEFPELIGMTRTAIMGENGPDIALLTQEAKRTFPYSIECKSRKRVGTVYEALEQAQKADPDLCPVVVLKGDYKRPLAILDLDDFLRLAKL